MTTREQQLSAATKRKNFLALLAKAKKEDEERVALLTRHLPRIGTKTEKVRYLFAVPGRPDLMLVYVSDAWSAYDFRFGFVMPGKGVILNLSAIAVKRILRKEYKCETDLVAYSRYIDEFLPLALRGNRDIWERATIVRRCEMIPREVVFRFNLYGSAWRTYHNEKNARVVCGQQLEDGLPLFFEFPEPLSSPTTKAHVGHDEQVTVASVETEYPGLLATGIEFGKLIQRYLDEDRKGRLLDGKFEFGRLALVDPIPETGRDPQTGRYVLCDEVSPDSIRLCDYDAYHALALGEVPAEFLDKEFGRQWAESKGIARLKPTWKRHRERVARWEPTEEFVTEFMRRYHKAFTMLSRGHAIDEYKKVAMSLH